ncbi:lysine-rich arabinogalactan protein 19-like [Neodiprion lecontei]|uniref:Lysine-rich arabinogalactan protein 19-like n=1 Tax=Neodiprion lecontei TaxID=441921 RepID=A0A6J0BCA5_NEOLC|nr:lysine-rich arabinogalactan protein 19-like [Neodiprion lecontei]
MTDPVQLATASPTQKTSACNPPAPWVLHRVNLPSRPLTRPPAVLQSVWDVRRARVTSPSYYRRIPAAISPFPEPQRIYVSTATQTTQSDSEWESPQRATEPENRRPPTPPSSPESRYTPPPRTAPTHRCTSSLQPPPRCNRATTAPSLAWKPLI